MTGATTTVDGVTIRFDVVGAGPPLLLVHGLGDDRRLWSAVSKALATRFTTVALDLRGHGESDDASDFDPFALHRDIEAVLRATELERPYLIGHSLGGVAVSTCAARRSVRGVINLDQPLDLRGLSARVRGLGDGLFTRPAHETVFGVLREIGFGGLSDADIESLKTTRRRLTLRALLGLWGPLLLPEPELRAAVRAAVSGISTPYLSIHGADPGAHYAGWLAELIPNARVEVWEGAGHFMHVTDPERFVSRVLAFCGEH